MPLFQTIHTPEAATIGIWRIEESVDDLERGLPPNLWQQNLYRSITSIRRQKEWLATRALIRQILPKDEVVEIAYDAYGKPMLHRNTRQLSISHSHHFAAVIVHAHQSLGIDIEPIHPRILRLQHKFLSKKEAAQIAVNDLFMLTLYWSAKETLYKLYGKKELRFKENLLIHKHYSIADSAIAAKGYLETSICKENLQWNVKVYYQQIEDNILTYAFANV